MPRGASPTEHKRAQLSKLGQGVRAAKRKVYDRDSETLLEGKGAADLINATTGAARGIREAEKKLRQAQAIPAEENVLRRGYNQKSSGKLATLDTLVDTSAGPKRKSRLKR